MPIKRFRIFVSERDSTAQTLNFETPDAKLSYKLKTTKQMIGKYFTVSVQAINKNGKMSLVSEPAIFLVANMSKPLPPTAKLPSPITNLQAVSVAYDKIVLSWPEVSDAEEYKLKWDRGDSQSSSLFFDLPSLSKSSVVLTANNTDSVLGALTLKNKGGTFFFKLSYLSKVYKIESEVSKPLKVVVPAKP